ncbi:MAG: CbtB-domain containing protein [Rhodobacteraceae bacterium]|nr:MAG: CbtB-domain containing protein [Paracoccaceae bacterium]
MTTQTQTTAASASSPLVAVILAAVLGLGLITVTGHVQASTLHDAAHDVRHATGFPCH